MGIETVTSSLSEERGCKIFGQASTALYRRRTVAIPCHS